MAVPISAMQRNIEAHLKELITFHYSVEIVDQTPDVAWGAAVEKVCKFLQSAMVETGSAVQAEHGIDLAIKSELLGKQANLLFGLFQKRS